MIKYAIILGIKVRSAKASFYKAKTAEKERRRKVQTAQFFAEDTAREPQDAGTAAGHAARVSFDQTAGPAGESQKGREDRLAQEHLDPELVTSDFQDQKKSEPQMQTLLSPILHLIF